MNDTGTIDDLYFEWLYGFVGSVKNKNPTRSYWNLCKQLYTKPFSWTVPNDDNREEDGKDLRGEFMDHYEINIDEMEPQWLELDCSMLEMLLALARRASFESYGEPIEWFWKFINNLQLREYTDEVYNIDAMDTIDGVLDRVILRQYDRNGVGGLFPLSNATKDQRKVELWYQLSAYLLECGYEDDNSP